MKKWITQCHYKEMTRLIGGISDKLSLLVLISFRKKAKFNVVKLNLR